MRARFATNGRVAQCVLLVLRSLPPHPPPEVHVFSQVRTRHSTQFTSRLRTLIGPAREASRPLPAPSIRERTNWTASRS